MERHRVRHVFLVVLLGIAAWGCATTQGVVREGKEYGVTRGVFHGRWWNYYERGSSYLSGDFFQEAEADFKQALQARSKDVWQARTYGLHFVEFFPNRELGVTYFRMNRLDEAEKYLKLSLEQMDTDRAHHFIDQVKRAKIAKGEIKSETPPTLETSIQDGAIMATRDVPVEIHASDTVGVAQVNINGATIPQRGSAEKITMKEKVLLTEGTHEIKIEAGNLADKGATKTVKVEVDLTGPTIGIFTPTDALVTEAALTKLEGTTVDKNGVTSVAMGQRVIAQSKGVEKLPFATELPLTDGENSFMILARDVAGNQTPAMIKVFKGKPGSASARLWQLKQRAPQLLKFAQAGDLAGIIATLTQSQAPAPGAEGPTINLISPSPDKAYHHDKTVSVSGEVVVGTKVASLSINGEPFTTLTGAPKEVFNKRISLGADALKQGEAKVKISVKAQDDQNRETVKEFDATVKPVLYDSKESKMPVAVLAFEGKDVDPVLAANLRTTTETKVFERSRFDVLERARLQDILTEQKLAAALANPNDAISLGKMSTAYVILVAEVYKRDEKGVEIKAKAIDTETSSILEVLDVFVEDKDKIDAGCANLADQFIKKFPRLSGELMAVREVAGGAEMLVNWTKDDGIREGAYLMVVHEEASQGGGDWGAIAGAPDVKALCRAKIQKILPNAAQGKVVNLTVEGIKLEKGMAAITM